MTEQSYRSIPTIGNRVARELGQLGDLYELTADDAEYATSRQGRGDDIPALVAGDVIMRVAYSGDCFGYYAVFRDRARLDAKWCGYDGVGTHIGNALHEDGPQHLVGDALDAFQLPQQKGLT